MSDTVQLALIAGAGPFLLAVVTAILQIRHGWKVDKLDTKVVTLDTKVDVVQGDVLKIEKATNSMKDALVKATGDAAFAEGHAEGVRDEKTLAGAMRQKG